MCTVLPNIPEPFVTDAVLRCKGAPAAADGGGDAAPAARRPLPKNKKRGGGGEEVEDRLDRLVAAYKTQVSAAAAGLDKWL